MHNNNITHKICTEGDAVLRSHESTHKRVLSWLHNSTVTHVDFSISDYIITLHAKDITTHLQALPLVLQVPLVPRALADPWALMRQHGQSLPSLLVLPTHKKVYIIIQFLREDILIQLSLKVSPQKRGYSSPCGPL